MLNIFKSCNLNDGIINVGLIPLNFLHIGSGNSIVRRTTIIKSTGNKSNGKMNKKVRYTILNNDE